MAFNHRSETHGGTARCSRTGVMRSFQEAALSSAKECTPFVSAKRTPSCSCSASVRKLDTIFDPLSSMARAKRPFAIGDATRM